MKVYLIKPRFPVTYWGFEYSQDLSGVGYTSPPLGLATIAALTPPDIDVEICDENIEDIDYANNCDIVGLTAYLMQGPRAFHIAEEFRKRGKVVVLGGPITGLNLADCRGKVDVIFVGEAEYTWKQFLEEYRQGKYQTEYVQTEKIDMHDSPVPRMDLLKLNKYVHAAIQTTRGCPFGCEFCDIVVLFGRKVRYKKVSQVIAEMQEAVKQSVDSIFFTDDNFIGNRKYVKELLNAIIEFNAQMKKPVAYMTQVSINLAKDDELLDLMHRANITTVFIGIETPRKASLKEVNKGQNVKTDLLQSVAKIQSYNISVSAGMIVGFDHDDLNIFQEQLDFIMDANIPWAMTGILQAVPETPLYKRLQAENRLDLSAEYFEVDNTALDVNLVPKNMTKDELVKGYTWLVRQLYSYENYAKRVVGTLQRYTNRTSQSIVVPSAWQLKVVLRTLRYYLLTLDRKRRKFFYDIVSYTLRHKPFALVEAITYIVSFKHLHHYVNIHLEKVLEQKAAMAATALPQPVLENRWAIFSAYDELRKHAATVSQQATAAYDEIKTHAATVGKHAAEEYEELRKHAASAQKCATTKYEELKTWTITANVYSKESHQELGAYVTALGQQALASYEDLHHQALAARKQAALAYEELGKQAASVSHQATTHYEELRKLAAEKSEQALAAYDELQEYVAVLKKHVRTVYGELSEQAAAISAQAATVSKRAAAMYQDLEQQAIAANIKAANLIEELESILLNVSSPQAIQKG
ncbi:hypothetical protein CSA56_04435 [candidate division KSB3 bacterium]|uniref:Uncharacterized protein n=1 Tax=candidate division KSB3 bacterium TaxID=2044937 RepID=A0A2G6KI74_9BACT|nr:MAG: hypothetical protein CSA56_04435 [candidate division KSB3 bacterium]